MRDPPHVPVLLPPAGHAFPACRDPCLRLQYIDDALLVSSVRIDMVSTPLLPMLAPHGKLASCGLGVPGDWLPLQHRLRDIDRNAKDIGMLLNVKKNNMIIFFR